MCRDFSFLQQTRAGITLTAGMVINVSVFTEVNTNAENSHFAVLEETLTGVKTAGKNPTTSRHPDGATLTVRERRGTKAKEELKRRGTS